MMKLETLHQDGEWEYTLNGEALDKHVKIQQSSRAPHPAITLDGQPLYGVEWWVESQLQAIIPQRCAETEAVYEAFRTGDWSAVPAPHWDHPLGIYQAAEAAVRDSPGRKAQIRWGQIERIINISIQNLGDLTSSLDTIENHAVPPRLNQLSTDELLVIDQRIYNVAASLDSVRDQLLSSEMLRAYKNTAFGTQVEAETKQTWDRPELAFLQGLRNTLVHKYQLGAGLDIEMGGDKGAARVVIHPGALLINWPRTFPQPGKDFAAQHERLDLRSYMMNCVGNVARFGDWIIQGSLEFHSGDCEELARLEEELIAAERQLNDLPVTRTVKAHGPFTLSYPPPDSPGGGL